MSDTRTVGQTDIQKSCINITHQNADVIIKMTQHAIQNIKAHVEQQVLLKK